MSKYIKYCNTLQDFFDLEYCSPRITHINTTEECIYNYIGNENYYEEIKYKIPLSFEILEDGTVGSTFTKVVEYSLNGDTWKLFNSNVSVKEGDVISFRGDNNQYGDNSSTGNLYKFNTTCRFNIFGNIMSLINSSNFSNLNSIQSSYCFSFLFYNCNKLISAKNLILPITTLTSGCYWNTFGNCSSLISAPSLPATTLAQSCYSGMFEDCSSLTIAPELPATTLALYCYNGMFSDCTSLTEAPKLPATTLADGCYGNMFQGCTSLITMPHLISVNLAKECYWGMFKGCTSLTNIFYLPATTLAESCYKNMFMNCININVNSLNDHLSIIFFNVDYANRVKVVQLIRKYTGYGLVEAKDIMDRGYISEDELLDLNSLIGELINLNVTILSDIGFFLPATTLTKECYANMFSGCTSLTTAPQLPATNLAEACYSNMFYYCTSLITVPELPAITLVDGCYSSMFYGCSSLTTAPELPATTLGPGCYNSMFRNCTSLINVPSILPAKVLKNICYAGMFSNCTSLTATPQLPAITLANQCYLNMFSQCINLTTAPELPATTLAEGCYWSMFVNCRSLNYIKCLATNISATDCLKYWVSGVSSFGTFVKDSSINDWPTGVNGIPSGWTVENFNTNYLKLGENTIGHNNNLSSETGSGTIIEVGSGFDINDLTNNPPIIYYSDGTIIGGGIPSRWTNTTTFEIYGAYHIVLTFNSSTNPTQYTFIKTPGGGSDN